MRGRRARGRGGVFAGRTGATVAAAGLVAAAVTVGIALESGPAAAQDELRVPTIPAGVPVALLPAQSVQPAATGGWPGGAVSASRALEAMNAELDFALAEVESAREWVRPGQAVERAARNPTLQVNPARLAYQRLMNPDEDADLPDPLHGQLRWLSALLNTRLVVVPVALWYERGAPDPRERGERIGPPLEMIDDVEAVPGRAVMRLAVVDTRRSRVLWHGEIEGDFHEVDSPAALATLAARIVRALSPS